MRPSASSTHRRDLGASHGLGATAAAAIFVVTTAACCDEQSKEKESQVGRKAVRSKLGHYKQLPSLRVVLLISHRRPQVTVVERTAQGWAQRDHRAGDSVTLADPALTFSVDELYAGIQLDDGPPGA